MNWIFSGIDRHGNNRTGVISGDQVPADVARQRWEAGWRSLDVRSDDEERHQVAAIERNLDTGRLSWWGDTAPGRIEAIPLEPKTRAAFGRGRHR